MAHLIAAVLDEDLARIFIESIGLYYNGRTSRQ
jgi:hypothetical protein